MTTMKDDKFTEGPYYAAYKVIRNKFRMFDGPCLIGRCLEFLHLPYNKPLDYIYRTPSSALLLIKWVLVDDEYLSPGRAVPSVAQARALINEVFQLSANLRMPGQNESLAMFIRTMAMSQLLYQRPSTIAQAARQMLYYDGLDETHYIPSQFRETTGVALHRFLYLAMGLHIAFVTETEPRISISPQWFESVRLDGAEDEIRRFLGMLSAPLAEVRLRLLVRDDQAKKDKRATRPSSEFFELTPFVRTPLLPASSGEFKVIHPYLLENCLENFVYNKLREQETSRFMASFGLIFERYVGRAVRYLKLPHRTEDELKAMLAEKQSGKLVDFIVADGGANVFIDAKAAEMNYHGVVTHDPHMLAKLLDASLLKGIAQAEAVAHKLASLESSDAVFGDKPANYLILVTYARFDIANGNALAQCIGADHLANLLERSDRFKIPLENMYFMTVEEFDSLAAQVHVGAIGLVEALERAKLADARPETAQFIFQMHLEQWGMAGRVPDYLVQRTVLELQSYSDRIRNAGPRVATPGAVSAEY